MKRVGCIPKSALADGQPARIPYPPYDVFVVRVGDEVFALEDACNHAGASLAEGDVVAGRVRCPMHGYEFDLRTGELVLPRGLCADQRRFEVTFEGDDVVVWDPARLRVI
jgi:3-phenylpropionate/trans-cinnamate dioxygenase ferredoxin subunit